MGMPALFGRNRYYILKNVVSYYRNKKQAPVFLGFSDSVLRLKGQGGEK